MTQNEALALLEGTQVSIALRSGDRLDDCQLVSGAVETTPGSDQKAFSAPQKQPRAKTAVRVPSGQGGTREAPSMMT